MDPNKRRAVAIWRMNILGPLVSARLEHGDKRELLEEAASRTYVTPGGRRVRFTWRTLEGWYYAYKSRGLAALEPRTRADQGECKAIPADLAQRILDLRREEPRRSVRILIRAVERAKLAQAGTLAPSTVTRLLRAHGLAQRPRALPERERRAFTVPLPGDLWVGDAQSVAIFCDDARVAATRVQRGRGPQTHAGSMAARRSQRAPWSSGQSMLRQSRSARHRPSRQRSHW